MKKISFWLMAALVLGISMSVTSCKDDDNDSNNTSEKRNEDADPLDTDEAETAWRWLNYLTDAESLDDDWATKTYTPNIGVESENNQNTRIVVVSDLEEAQAKFADIAGVEASQLSGDYTASQSGVGSLAWSPSGEGAENLAEVTVSTRLIPSLQKIIYCTEDQIGKNGLIFRTVKGTAYYRLGDVIRDDKTGQYWVCVRPSFEQDDKEESHWMCIFNSEAGNNLPADNIYSKYNESPKYGGKTIKLPTNLTYSREHMNNLVNLVYALLNPQAFENATKVDGKKNGLCKFDYQYHGMSFLFDVADNWEATKDAEGNDLWQVLFNKTKRDLQNDMTAMILLYKGYQWRIGNTGYVWEFKSSAIHPKALGSENGDMQSYNFGEEGFDITTYTSAKDSKKGGGPDQFQTDGDYRWVVAYAKGSELAKKKNGKYSHKTRIEGYTDIYRYNDITLTPVGAPLETEKSLDQATKGDIPAKPGSIIGADGKFYATRTLAEDLGGGAVALVMALNPTGQPLEFGTQYNGMAMSLEPTKAAAMTDVEENGDIDFVVDCGLSKYATWADHIKVLNGLSITNQMDFNTGCHNGHVHPAVDDCFDFEPEPNLTDKGKALHSYSKWFMPTFGQWLVGLQGLGWELPTKDGDNTLYRNNVTRLKRICSRCDLVYDNIFTPFWTCSLAPTSTRQNPLFAVANVTFLMSVDSYYPVSAKSEETKARPFILFKAE